MLVTVGQTFTAAIDDSSIPNLGARVEVPQTRAIVSAWQPAVSDDGISWQVTLESPPAAGDYVLVWRSGDPDPFVTQANAPQGPLPDPTYELFVPLFAAAATTTGGTGGNGGAGGEPLWPDMDHEQVRPTADDVARLERARIVDLGGHDVGTFTDETRPTVAEVESLVEQAIDDTSALLPAAFDPAHYGAVKSAVALYTATLIEASYFREELGGGSVAIYREMYLGAIAALVAKMTEDERRETMGATLADGGAVLT